MEPLIPLLALGIVALGVLVTLRRRRSRQRRLDPEGWRLIRRRRHWRADRQHRSPGSLSYEVALDRLGAERNARLNELIAARDVAAAAALLEAAGFPAAEAIDRAERYTLRPHPEADTRGLGAGRRRGAVELPPAAAMAEARARAGLAAAPGGSAGAVEAEIAALMAAGRKIHAVKLYRSHYGTDLRTAKLAVEAMDRDRRAGG
ncbi:hypothetical protein LNKW23_36370 [Paralimibaculum aggregatum]|uniref:Ribosomal protein L7/L12 C-terminal domain-containing protein n=1 Tax=Paralimibaculum aggregatum TaxID=3036245 RepID=A0ABQ6LMJ3_9RHOB|nr:hypothetical protein [Limibaculum sp. NKW23]GMG84421.1 hypothetical protein LNKW23_36370 [Limibaculum sp. NKW23]